MPSPAPDAAIERLATLFREHEAWIAAARQLDAQSSSGVYFSHRPGEAWRLVFRDGGARLEPGAAADPDLVFRFTPASVERLSGVPGGMGEFAVTLFELMLEDDAELRVGFRIVAGFGRLTWRGYVRLLLAAGPKVLAFGASHGVGSLGALRRFVAQLRANGPAEWESGNDAS